MLMLGKNKKLIKIRLFLHQSSFEIYLLAYFRTRKINKIYKILYLKNRIIKNYYCIKQKVKNETRFLLII